MKRELSTTLLYRLRRKLAAIIFQPERFEYAPAQELQERHLRNARILPTRLHVLDRLPRGGTVIEVGVQRGDFSAELLKRLSPTKLHLVDNAPHWCAHLRDRYAAPIAGGGVELHQGDSADVLASFPDMHFDLIYLDANHAYAFIRRELEISLHKVKRDGLIMCNDYIFYDHILGLKYGVVEAVHEFCLANDWEILWLSFDPQMFNDVCLRRIQLTRE